uniref:NADH dehydrogenase subunit 6 n=1 Tax=Nihonogomphus lieftincki TaxID=1904530 RepID=UPI0023F2B1DD|nr:NADH dehydrogenase subunit 6 [Nihonogomphus lieftincki]WDY83491.1 NADH dehydrogenase subunit 6 [Nihonogomphus lieftincki]
MSQILFTINMSINSILFTKMNHPMNMGILLLIQTLMTCMLTGLMSQTPWFSYILFLVFLGGMLVLFIYMTSIASNEIFQKSNYLLIIIGSTVIMFIMFILMLIDPMMISINNTAEAMNMTFMFKNNESMMLSNLYNMPNAMITLFMVMYLFLTLIVIVFITKSHQGPLRPNH